MGSAGKYNRAGRSLLRLMGKGPQEGATPKQGVESSGLDTSTVKVDKQGGFQATPQLPVGRGLDYKGPVHGM